LEAVPLWDSLLRGYLTIQNLNKKNRSTKANPNINTFFLSMLSPLIYRFILPYFMSEKSDENERGRGVIRVMNEGIQKHLIKKTTLLKVKRSVEKGSFVKGTVLFVFDMFDNIINSGLSINAHYIQRLLDLEILFILRLW